MDVRKATSDDEERVVAALTTSFADDPVWGWALPDLATRAPFWRFFARHGIERGSAWVIDDGKAVAIWATPGVPELDDGGEAELESLYNDLLGPAAPLVREILEVLEAVHPTDEPHYYLSLLGTHDNHRGQGLGMALLAENIRAIDAEGRPAYLESTNPRNLARYASVGFEPRDEITIPGEGQVVTTMWREARR
jgi:GNAT superfamily N-acetyltransferase